VLAGGRPPAGKHLRFRAGHDGTCPHQGASGQPPRTGDEGKDVAGKGRIGSRAAQPEIRLRGFPPFRFRAFGEIRADPAVRIGGAAVRRTRPPLAGLRPARENTAMMLRIEAINNDRRHRSTYRNLPATPFGVHRESSLSGCRVARNSGVTPCSRASIGVRLRRMSMQDISPLRASPGNISDATTTIIALSRISPTSKTFRRSAWMNFPSAGGCDFPCDPEIRPDRQALFWIPSLQPRAVELKPAEHRAGATEPIVTLARLDGVDLRHAADGWHGIWQVDGVTHQFWLRNAVPNVPALYGSFAVMDDFHDLRCHAAQRLRRALCGRPPGRDFRAIPAQLRRFISSRCARSMPACAARATAPSPKSCLGSAARKRISKVDPRKNKARRLVAHGIRMMRGGYRLLLHYPIKASGR
jgi:hypothetical protein